VPVSEHPFLLGIAIPQHLSVAKPVESTYPSSSCSCCFGALSGGVRLNRPVHRDERLVDRVGGVNLLGCEHERARDRDREVEQDLDGDEDTGLVGWR
jgi:hypothetical protein